MLQYLRYSPTSRVDMARRSGLSGTIITNFVTLLLGQGVSERVSAGTQYGVAGAAALTLDAFLYRQGTQP